jgi:hypothetical protein
MRSCNGLEIILRVPIWIKDHNHPSFGQINTQASSSCSKQENPEFIILIESLDRSYSILTLDTARQHFKTNSLNNQKLFDNFDHPFKLWEYKHFVVVWLVLVDKLI